MGQQRIAVIGGGLTGLAIAFHRARAGDEVVLLESSDRFGGQLWSERRDGFVIEHGAEGFVARSTAVPALAEALGIGEHLVDQRVFTSFGFEAGALHALAPGSAARFLGFQVSGDELGRGIRSFAGGMGELAEALEHGLRGRAQLHASLEVTRLSASSTGWQLECGRERVNVVADAVVVATGARAASRLLTAPFGAAAEQLGQAATLSSVTVTLAFAAEDIEHPLDGTGFVVATADQRDGCRACTFASSKFAGRAPADKALLRLFFRPTLADLELTDEAWTERALSQLTRILRLRSPALRAFVSRWCDALPVFDDAHRERVAAVERALEGRRLFLAGSAFHGSGIDAAVRSAERVAALLG